MVTRGSYSCYYCYYYFFLSICHQEDVGFRPVPVFRLQEAQPAWSPRPEAVSPRILSAYLLNQQSKHVSPVQRPGGSREGVCHAQAWAWTPEVAAPGLAWPA